jgi:cytochrome c oxidase assembly protein subunit 15
MNCSALERADRWPHCLAVLLCCATFPLIWVGGLVTTYDAGMAVPDWPSTYGYNLFLYPWTIWLSGPWDLFIEHGHRLLGAVVGILTITLVATVWRYDDRRWLRVLSLGALALVIGQGVLGGARVLLDDRFVAMLHGCLGPAFFAYCVGLAVCTSPFWKSSVPLHSPSSRLPRLALLTCLLAYLQLILGAQLRHIPATFTPIAFQIVVWFHLAIAVVLLWHVVYLAVVTMGGYREVGVLRNPVLLLTGLLLVQFTLGASTWIVKYGWPHWFSDYQIAASHTVQANSFWQATIVTGHVAIGSLIVAVSLLITVRSLRLFRTDAALCGSGALGSGALLMGIAT